MFWAGRIAGEGGKGRRGERRREEARGEERRGEDTIYIYIYIFIYMYIYSDKTIQFGLANMVVNLTNAYDVPEVTDEQIAMKKIGSD